MKPSYNENVWEKIKNYDRALELEWNHKKCRWELWRKGKNRRCYVATFENKDGSFRPVDHRMLSYLANCDGWRKADSSRKAALAIDREIREYDRKKELAWERDYENNLIEISKHVRKKVARGL